MITKYQYFTRLHSVSGLQNYPRPPPPGGMNHMLKRFPLSTHHQDVTPGNGWALTSMKLANEEFVLFI